VIEEKMERAGQGIVGGQAARKPSRSYGEEVKNEFKERDTT
jgi:hypothetical protein